MNKPISISVIIKELLVLILFTLGVCPQAWGQHIKQYEKFVVLTRSGTRIEGRNAVVSSSDLRGVSLGGKELAIPLSDIKTLYVSARKKTALMAILGGGVGLAIALEADMQAHERGRSVGSDAIIGVTAGCAIIGGIIGSQMDSWEAVSLQGNPLSQ